MQDAITNVINKSDVQGLYLDTASMTNLESISPAVSCVFARRHHQRQRLAIIRDAVAKALLFGHHPPAATCTPRLVRRLHPRSGHYLRYSTYMLAGDTSILMNVLNGLKGYNSWVCPSAPPFKPFRP